MALNCSHASSNFWNRTKRGKELQSEPRASLFCLFKYWSGQKAAKFLYAQPKEAAKEIDRYTHLALRAGVGKKIMIDIWARFSKYAEKESRQSGVQ